MKEKNRNSLEVVAHIPRMSGIEGAENRKGRNYKFSALLCFELLDFFTRKKLTCNVFKNFAKHYFLKEEMWAFRKLWNLSLPYIENCLV